MVRNAFGATGEASLITQHAMRNDRAAALDSAFVVADSRRPTLTYGELQRLVQHWVGLLKEAGLPPEEALIAVKELVRDTIVPRYGHAGAADEPDVRLALVCDAAQWCIEAYFDSPAVPNGSGRSTTNSSRTG